jgi:hypothetical protein
MSADTALEQVPLFQHLDEHALQHLARRAGRLSLARGTIVLREGDASVGQGTTFTICVPRRIASTPEDEPCALAE